MDQHFILTLGRSGSNALVDLINQHPNAVNYGELLGDWNLIQQWRNRLGLWPDQDAAYLDGMLSNGAPLRTVNSLRNLRKMAAGKKGENKRYSDIQTVGAKDFTHLFAQPPALSNYLHDRPEIKVVGLYRNDLVARFISWKLLEHTGTVKHTLGDKPSSAQIRLDTDTLLRDLTVVADEASKLEKMLELLTPSQVFRIEYEAFFFDDDVMKSTVQEMFAFLGLPPHPFQMRARKINNHKLRKTVLNYEACLEALNGTPFEEAFRATG
jgi:hypothetical protein